MPALCMLLWAESLCFRLHMTRGSLDSSSDEEPSWIRLVVLRCEKFVGGLTWKQGSKKIFSPPSFSLSNSWQYTVNGEDEDLHLEVIHCPAKAAKTSHPLLFSSIAFSVDGSRHLLFYRLCLCLCRLTFIFLQRSHWWWDHDQTTACSLLHPVPTIFNRVKYIQTVSWPDFWPHKVKKRKQSDPNSPGLYGAQ